MCCPCSKSSREARGPGAECVMGRVGGGEGREVAGDWISQGLEGHCRDLGFCSAGNGELLKDFEQKNKMSCLHVKRITQATELRTDRRRQL